MSTFCVRHSKQFQERLEPTSTFCIRCLIYRSITLRLLILSLKKKVSVFFKQKRVAVEDGEAEEVSSTSNQPPELQEPKASSLTSTVRKFHPEEKCIYLWLQYDKEKGM